MKSITLLALLPILCLAQQLTTIKGKVVGTDGQPLAMAHVRLSGGVGIEDVHFDIEDPFFFSTQVQKDGSFTISTDSLGGLRLWCTAVGYHPFNIPIVLDHPTNLDIDLRLEPYQITPTEEGIEIFHDFDDVTKGKRAFLKEAAPGIFAIDIPTRKKEFKYRINSLHNHPLGITVPYATNDGFEYFREGLYTTLVHPAGDTVRIQLDLSKASATRQSASYRFSDPNCLQARIADRYFKSLKEKDRCDKALYDYMVAGGKYSEFKYDWVPFATELKRDLDGAQDQLTADELVMEYLEMAVFSKNTIFSDQLAVTERAQSSAVHRQTETQRTVKKTLDGISATSPLWVYHKAIALQAAKYHPLKDAFVDRIIQTHPSRSFQAYLTFRKFTYLSSGRRNAEQERLFSVLVNEYRDTPAGKMARSTITFPDSVKIGSPLPLFYFTDLDNSANTFSNRTFQGKYFLLCFWATWCGSCVEEIPHLQKAYEKYHPLGLDILSVSYEKPSAIAYFRSQRYKMPWYHTAVEEEDQGDVMQRFGVCWPETILVGPDGTVLDLLRGFGGNALGEMTSKNLPLK